MSGVFFVPRPKAHPFRLQSLRLTSGCQWSGKSFQFAVPGGSCGGGPQGHEVGSVTVSALGGSFLEVRPACPRLQVLVCLELSEEFL